MDNLSSIPVEAASTKEEIRRKVWTHLEDHNIARFPRPVFRRIPNFVGAEEAAKRAAELSEFEAAARVKVNPDSPQRPVRMAVLSSGKVLLMPTPRLSQGFLLLDRRRVAGSIAFASSIKGAFSLGEKVPLGQLPNIDLIVVGSVAVSRDGARIGKGEGYSELEYGILRECKLVNESTTIITTVHDAQVVEHIPVEEHDISVDYIVTPTRVIKTERAHPRPEGIIWKKVNSEMLERMPILAELRKKRLST